MSFCRWQKLLVTMAALCLAVCLAACSGGGSGGGGKSGAVMDRDAPATGSEFSQPAAPRMPSPNLDGDPAIDVSHVNEGYVSARATDAARLKFQVKSGDMTYNYDLPNTGEEAVFPINMGSGTYEFRIMRNTEGSNYVELMSEPAEVALESEFVPFDIPNLYCNYTPSSDCVTMARKVTEDAPNQGEAVKAVCTYLVENITYDTDKAEKLSTATGYIPNPDDTLRTGTGICFDYASLAAAMLRSMGFPTKIITGYVGSGDSIYHAWIMVYADGQWHTGMFAVDPKTWSRVDVTFAAAGASDFVGDGSAYTDRYVY